MRENAYPLSIKLRKSVAERGIEISENATVAKYQLRDIDNQYIYVANIAPIIYNRYTMNIWVDGLLNDPMGRVRGAGSFSTMFYEAMAQYGKKYNLFSSRIASDVYLHTQFSPFKPLPYKEGRKNVLVIFDALLLKYPARFPAGIRGNLQWWMNKLFLKKYDGFLTISETSRTEISNIMGIEPEKIQNIGCAAKKIFYEDQSNTETKLPFELPTSFILYVGDVTWNKNLVRFAKAVVQTQIPTVLVGKALTERVDPANKWTEDLVLFNEYVKKYPGLFTIIGNISDGELVEVYKKSNGVCLPSLDEGFGLPWLEGALLNKPLIVSDISIFREISKGTSLYFDPYTVDSMASGLRSLMEITPEQNQVMIQNQRKQALEFTQEAFISKLSQRLFAILK